MNIKLTKGFEELVFHYSKPFVVVNYEFDDHNLTHECTHLLEFGHTKRFYEIQTSQMFDWGKWKNKLEKLLA